MYIWAQSRHQASKESKVFKNNHFGETSQKLRSIPRYLYERIMKPFCQPSAVVRGRELRKSTPPLGNIASVQSSFDNIIAAIFFRVGHCINCQILVCCNKLTVTLFIKGTNFLPKIPPSNTKILIKIMSCIATPVWNFLYSPNLLDIEKIKQLIFDVLMPQTLQSENTFEYHSPSPFHVQSTICTTEHYKWIYNGKFCGRQGWHNNSNDIKAKEGRAT